MLGEEGLLRLAHEAGEAGDDSGFVDRLVDRVRGHAAGADFPDDVTAMLLCHNGADPPRQSIGERLRVLGKMMGIGD